MMQGVLSNQRVRLLFSKGMKTYRPRRKGERKRKSVRGCIVGPDLAVPPRACQRRRAQISYNVDRSESRGSKNLPSSFCVENGRRLSHFTSAGDAAYGD